MEEVMLQNLTKTRANVDGDKAAFCTARLSPDFHHDHAPSPLGGFV
jgi:hypothetical protein